MIAGYLLEHPKLWQGLDDNLQQLWIWHSVEEVEHKVWHLMSINTFLVQKDKQGKFSPTSS